MARFYFHSLLTIKSYRNCCLDIRCHSYWCLSGFNRAIGTLVVNWFIYFKSGLISKQLHPHWGCNFYCPKHRCGGKSTREINYRTKRGKIVIGIHSNIDSTYDRWDRQVVNRVARGTQRPYILYNHAQPGINSCQRRKRGISHFIKVWPFRPWWDKLSLYD